MNTDTNIISGTLSLIKLGVRTTEPSRLLTGRRLQLYRLLKYASMYGGWLIILFLTYKLINHG